MNISNIRRNNFVINNSYFKKNSNVSSSIKSYSFNPYHIKTGPIPFKLGISIWGSQTNVDGGKDILSY